MPGAGTGGRRDNTGSETTGRASRAKLAGANTGGAKSRSKGRRISARTPASATRSASHVNSAAIFASHTPRSAADVRRRWSALANSSASKRAASRLSPRARSTQMRRYSSPASLHGESSLADDGKITALNGCRARPAASEVVRDNLAALTFDFTGTPRRPISSCLGK